MGDILRLDKYLTDMGLGTRSEVKQWIKKGRVKINDIQCKRPETKVNSLMDVVTFDEKKVEYQKYFYYMLHKPAGVVSATVDHYSTTVIDLIKDKEGKKLFPVGRLDKDTEGLLIITNDGAMAHNLLSPKKHVEKVYYAKVQGKVTEEDVEAFAQGVDIGEKVKTLPGRLTIVERGDISTIELTICEGKYHQVKRMFQAVGKEVIYLKRLAMGGLMLDDDLPVGEYRELREDEIAYLKGLTPSGLGGKTTSS